MENNPHKSIIVIVCGGIGAGKSMVTRLAAYSGYRVYDCDSRAKALMQREPLMHLLQEIVGEGLYTDGVLNRAYLASRIFTDSELRMKVNTAVHSAVREDIRHEITRLPEGLDKILFVETAIPTTSHLDAIADVICLVEAPQEMRIERVLRRNAELTRGDVAHRIAAQEAEYADLPKEKIFRIDNSGTNSLISQFNALIEKLNNIYHA